MKNPKIGFCRGDLDLFDDIKILVNECWLKLTICCLKFKDSFKNDTFYGASKSAGGGCNMYFRHLIWCSKQVQGMYLTQHQTILQYLNNWKKFNFLKIWQNPIFAIFGCKFTLWIKFIFFSCLFVSDCNFWPRDHMITFDMGSERWDVKLFKT